MSRHRVTSASCPLFPHRRTFVSALRMYKCRLGRARRRPRYFETSGGGPPCLKKTKADWFFWQRVRLERMARLGRGRHAAVRRAPSEAPDGQAARPRRAVFGLHVAAMAFSLRAVRELALRAPLLLRRQVLMALAAAGLDCRRPPRPRHQGCGLRHIAGSDRHLHHCRPAPRSQYVGRAHDQAQLGPRH